MKKLLLLFILPLCLFAQEKNVSTVEILNADVLEFENHPEKGKIKKLIGRVALQDGDVLLIADSAFIYEDSSDFEAFSNVKIKKADSLTIYGDYLFYDKGDKTAEMKGNVKIDNNEIILETTQLFYYIRDKYAYYPTPGTVVHPEFNLISQKGYYYEKYQYAAFIDQAKVESESYRIVGDTIHYFYNSKKSRFFGPTSIQTDSMTGFGNRGYHLPNQNILYLEDKAWVLTNDHYIKGDSLLFNDSKGKGWARNNVEWQDSSRTRTIYGNTLDYDQHAKTSLVTGYAIFENIMDNDTIYLSADTMSVYETFVLLYDSIFGIDYIDTTRITYDSLAFDTTFYLDSISVDTIYTNAIKAHYDVKILQENLSGIADSMLYLNYDSTFRFYTQPIVWSDSTQMSGDSMHIVIKNERIDELLVFGNTVMANVVMEDYFYNQMIGDKITGTFVRDTLRHLLMEGNAESLYFITDDKNRFVGANKGRSEAILIRMKANNIDQVVYLDQPKANFLPMREVNPKQINFPNFKWQMQYMPMSFEDLKQPGRPMLRNKPVISDSISNPMDSLQNQPILNLPNN